MFRLIVPKLKAAGLHMICTVIVAAISAFLVFRVWYPGRFSEMLDVGAIYGLLLLVEVGMGPLLSFVIYNTTKKRAELFRDYCVVGVLQLAALFYGMHSVFEGRPVFLVFVKDRIEVVTANELEDSSFTEVEIADFKRKALFGPKLACYERPTDEEQLEEIMFYTMAGLDVHLLPKHFKHCKQGDLLANAGNASLLLSNRTTAQTEMELLRGRVFYWLPILDHKRLAWTAVFETESWDSLELYDIDSFLP